MSSLTVSKDPASRAGEPSGQVSSDLFGFWGDFVRVRRQIVEEVYLAGD